MRRSITLLFILLIFFLSACGSSTPNQPVTSSIFLKDALGRNVTLADPAKKIISLAPSNTEIIYALGAGSRLVGRDAFSTFPEEAKSLPSIGDAMGTINIEQITSLKPDLVLAAPLTTPEQVKVLEDLGIKVFMLPNPRSFDDLYQNLETVGQFTGREKEARELIVNIRQRVELVRKKMTGVTEKPLVFYELDATDPAKPWTAGPGTFVDYLIQQAGGRSAGSKLTGDWAQISQEDLIVQNPDLILLGDAIYSTVTPENVAERPGWSQIKAVTTGQVLVFNDDLVSRPGPRMVDGLEEMAKIFHPEIFK